MNRRDFLKLAGVLSGGILLPFGAAGRLVSLPVEARHGDCLYRGSSDGKVYISGNEGKSWQLHTNFGSEFSIFGLNHYDSGHLHAQLEYQGHEFKLALAQNGKNWKTV